MYSDVVAWQPMMSERQARRHESVCCGQLPSMTGMSGQCEMRDRGLDPAMTNGRNFPRYGYVL